MTQTVAECRELIWDYFHAHGRDLPWRHEPFEPYQILVSEMMLQQTQVIRVIPKYQQFLELFPTIEALAAAPLSDVIMAWSGLGYNRRAKYLHQAAKQLAPLQTTWTQEALVGCTGIGVNTAAAVLTYAYNQAVPFIETNVRTVLIHCFFADDTGISDQVLRPYIEALLDPEHPREFMWAVMDYGSHLKAAVGNLNQQSRHYTKQTKFEGSRRQVRGAVLRALADGPYDLVNLMSNLGASQTDSRLLEVLKALEKEGLIIQENNQYALAT